jgi:argininosuccinate synthase
LEERLIEVKPKIVLAYSGGLDTSILVRILSTDYGYDVVCCHVDVGEARDPELIGKRALASGAIAVEVAHAQDEFARDFCFPALQANALYEGVYPLSAALSRPLIAKHLVQAARKHGASAIAHGSTGKGNDQVRFDFATKGLAPDLKIVAPQRERNITRDAAIEYAAKHGIEIPATKKSPYSVDENLWGRSIEGGVLEDPNQMPPEDAFAWTKSWQDAPNEPTFITIGFDAGLPVSLNGEALDPAALIRSLNACAGQNGVGRIDLMENRFVGIKSRENYECPAAIALIAAHKDLERFTTLGMSQRVKGTLDQKYAELIYEGFWYSPYRDALQAFNDAHNKFVTGEVTLRLFKGSCQVVGRASKFGIYNLGMSTYGADDQFDHRAAEGFIKLAGLQLYEHSRLHAAMQDPGKGA